jgi:hypothetical protein
MQILVADGSVSNAKFQTLSDIDTADTIETRLTTITDDISTNTTNIATNATNIATNTSNISSNTSTTKLGLRFKNSLRLKVTL